MRSEPLNIQNDRFLINRLIQQAPTHTLIREFFKNAEESASSAVLGEKLIKIYPVEIDGVRKLAFWNTGPGMSDIELKRATDLSSSIGKEMGLDGNYGIGAKVSGLTMSPEGIRYRSCREGTVSQVEIGYDDELETYARFGYDLGEDRSETILDVSDILINEGVDTSFDWTEVVLYGEAPEHDTVSEPLGMGKKVDRNYIPSEIFRRFSRFETDVVVRVDVAMASGGGKGETGRFRQLKTLTDVLPSLSNDEWVKHEESGVKIHFIHDPKAETSGHSMSSRANPPAASTTFCALVYKNERYDLKTKKGWSSAAPNFGIAFGSKVLTVEIEVPEGMALPNQYRNGLTWTDDRSDMKADEFTAIVRETMPEWVKEVIRQESPENNDNYDDLQSALQKLLDEHRVPTNTLKKADMSSAERAVNDDEGTDTNTKSKIRNELDNEIMLSGDDDTNPIPNDRSRGRRAHPRKRRIAPHGAKPSKQSRALERAPTIEVIHDPDAIAEKEMKGRAGRFYQETQTIYVNGNYPIIERMAYDLDKDLRHAEDPETGRRIAKETAIKSMAFRVGKTVCFAIAKRLSDDWNDEALEKATSPESLSMAADAYRADISEAKKWAKELLKLESVEQVAAA
ncbi:hypothetical protein [Litorimonas haliclonae]|uniref:hypothetical protein n=1 Tax=Litorimonas haliclonae TaxID=2081977 RepID=UPI0039EFCB22